VGPRVGKAEKPWESRASEWRRRESNSGLWSLAFVFVLVQRLQAVEAASDGGEEDLVSEADLWKRLRTAK